MADGGWGGNFDGARQIRLGLAFAAAYMREDAAALTVLAGGRPPAPVMEVLDGLVALTAAWGTALPDYTEQPGQVRPGRQDRRRSVPGGVLPRDCRCLPGAVAVRVGCRASRTCTYIATGNGRSHSGIIPARLGRMDTDETGGAVR